MDRRDPRFAGIVRAAETQHHKPPGGDKIAMRRLVWLMLGAVVAAGTPEPSGAEDDILIFAVVSETPKDKSSVAVKASVNDVISDSRLIASEAIMNNPAWRKLEICHALRIEGGRTTDGYKVSTVRVIEAGMLPMTLQSFAGDCLIKKAVEIAPLLD
jgi:hypothetical protein